MRLLPISLLLIACTSNNPALGKLGGGAAVSGGAFLEPQRYFYDSPRDDDPELSTDFEIVFCPDKSMPEYFPGGDIVYDGTYAISDGQVIVDVDGLQEAAPLAISEDGSELVDQYGNVLVRVAANPASCQ